MTYTQLTFVFAERRGRKMFKKCGLLYGLRVEARNKTFFDMLLVLSCYEDVELEGKSFHDFY